MAETITLAAVGSAALTEGIKFLYGQAGEVMNRWRERKEKAANGVVVAPEHAELADIDLPAAFEGELVSPAIHFDALERIEGNLTDLRKQLSGYADGTYLVGPDDRELLEATDALRRLLEAVYGQRITFKGERRASSGPVFEGEIEVDQVAGYAAAVRAKLVEGGTIRAKGKATRVESGGTFVGVDLDTMREGERASGNRTSGGDAGG